MQGLSVVANATQKIKEDDVSTWLDLYYSIAEDKVYTEPGERRYKLTELRTKHTEKQIEHTVNYFMSL